MLVLEEDQNMWIFVLTYWLRTVAILTDSKEIYKNLHFIFC